MSQSTAEIPLRAALSGIAPPPRPAPASHAAPLRRMHFNEGAWPPSPRVGEAVLAAMGGLNRYGDSYGGRLVAAIARETGLAPERIVVGNGSGELISLAATAFVEPGLNGVVTVPTFPRIGAFVRVCGGAVKSVPVRADGGNDIAGLIAAADAGTRLVWIATPNNPTGAAASAEELRHLALAAPRNAVLAVDEAYGEFTRAVGGPDALAVLREIDQPWFILRTFSKAYGLAGVRVGYALASSPAMADAFHRVRTTFNLNVLSLAAAAAAYEDPDYMWARVRNCVAERDRLRQRLSALGLDCLPSDGNFLAIRLPMAGQAAAAGLRQRGILVSEIKSPGCESYIRVTVGLAEDNVAFAEALGAMLGR
jgi:histidinol-phosphate aminotransferase